MKKHLLFALGVLLALPISAQDEDVTNYIQNAGFDTDLTWLADGSKKEIIDKSNVLSNRSIAGIAADSSVYALVNPSTPKSRPDGRTLEATNGFIGRVQGWTVETNQTFPKCEWVYFGTIPYDLAAQAIPIADDGSTYLETPQRPNAYSGADNVGFAYLRAGWGGRAVYKQTVKLPCAQYRLEYWAININANASKGKNLSKVTCRKDTWEDETGFNDTEWTLHTIEFTPTSEFSMEFGFESEGGSGSNPFLCIDGIKLYKIGEADPVELLQSDISDVEDECSRLATQASMSRFNSLYLQIDEFCIWLEDALDLTTQEELEAALRYANEMLEKFKQAIDVMDDINAIMNKIDNLIATTNYPGKEELQKAWDDLNDLKNGDDEETDYAALMLTAVDKAKQAIREYLLSQKDTASEENPADFTFLIQHPWFINDDAEPTNEDGIWYFPKQFDEETGEDRYSEGSASSPDLNSTGWYIAGASGGDQRLNWQRGRSCWNAWNKDFTTTLAVAQDLIDLPNGYYTISADLITESGYANGTQHVYAQSTAGKTVSAAALTIEGWDNSEWETVAMTNEEKVLVVDGKLTIGAEGTGNGSASAGWFLVTNFRLNFLGQASEEVIAEALKQSFDTQLADARAMAATMHFAGDKKALNDTIAKYQYANEKNAYIEALVAMQAALDEAAKSEAKYYEYLPTQETLDENPEYYSTKTLLWVWALVHDEHVDGHDAFSTETKPIAKFALDYVNNYIVCDTATYKQFDAVVDLLMNYVNTYIPAYDEASNIAYYASEKGKTALHNLMDKQKQALIAEMKDKETVDAYVNELKELIAKVNKQNIYENPNITDYTEFIINPNAEAVNGWDITIGNGDGNGQKSGQWMDDGSTRYFDSYNSGGLKNFKFSQVITDLPNGTYTVGCYTRTPAEGAYIFYAVENDTLFNEIPLNYYQITNDEGEEETVIASDKYGPIWENANAQIEAGATDDKLYAIANANGGWGRGWKHQESDNIEVKNHELTIGSMAGNEASQTPKIFAGTWYSVGGWTLTLQQMGDNSGWAGPIESGIASIFVNNSIADGIYTLSGVKTNSLQRGINIVITNGKVRKVMVK